MSGKVTPMLAQYLEIKGRHPDALLLFRMGDFYETFFEDAGTLAEITGVALTTRDRNSDHPIPLAGVPYHALDGYLTRLLEAGLTVAICEQVEDPAQAKGLVKRDVVEVLSPGTATTPELLKGSTSVYCLAYLPGADGMAGWAILDASTGDFRCGLEPATLADLCERHPIREVIVREDTASEQLTGWRASLPEVFVNSTSSAWFHPAFGRKTLQDHFQVQSLAPFGLDEDERALAIGAAGALLRYLVSLTLKQPPQVNTLRFCSRSDRLLLDEETLRNLEVFRTFRGERGEGTLIHHIDMTLTPMGRRLLEGRLAAAMTDLDELGRWHDGVEAAVSAREWRRKMRGLLHRIGDIERWAARATGGRLGPAHLRQLGQALATLVALTDTAHAQNERCPQVAEWTDALPDLSALTGHLLFDVA